MNLWKADELKSKTNISQRAIFRLFWCTVGYLVAGLVYGYRIMLLTLPFLIAIPILGAGFDAWRLRKEGFGRQ
jgi:hypothetical protein